ncbi:serum paraoxonase/arylesterase 2-like isoform X2 [Amphiura filiformis]|uniref:serum paraoxonase/arylesterase 2-like isoform X2 n=1 Tax=Amphiura filiformis TaxID=82378 RepID=UPI003B21CDEC
MASTKQLLISVVLVVVLAIIVRHAARVMFVLGLFNNKHNHAPGPCHYVKGIDTGSEDLHVLPNGFTFVSTGLTWPYMPYNASVRTGIYGFDFNQPADGVVWLPMEGDFNQDRVMSYHGISVWKDKANDEVTLFVIAHREKKDTVELFKFNMDDKKLQHMKTIESPSFNSERLFVVEIFLLWACGSIVYYDGNSAGVVDDGHFFANGMQLSSDGKTLYATLYGERALVVFKRKHDNSIEEIRRINVHLNADNINIHEETGDIWLGGAYRISVDPTISYGSIVRIQPHKEYTIDEYYSDDGKDLLMVSGAVRYEKQLLIGTIAHKLLLCKLQTL